MGWGEGLERLKKVVGDRVAGLSREDASPERPGIEHVAGERGYALLGTLAAGELPGPSLVLVDECTEVVRAADEPYLLLGNHDAGSVGTDGSDKPSRRGFIAVPHQVVLPHLLVSAEGQGALTPRHVLGLGVKIASALYDAIPVEGERYDTWREDDSPLRAFRRSTTMLDLGKGHEFRVHAASDAASKARELMTPQAVGLVSGLARSFDLEIRTGCVYAYCNYGDLVTDDLQVWEWVESAASRVLDLLRLWGAGAEYGADWSAYSHAEVERPASMDGALSWLRRDRG